MKSIYEFLENFLPDCGDYLIKVSLWLMYSALLFLFFDFLAFLKNGMTLQFSLSDLMHNFFGINNFYYAETSGVNASITGWVVIDKFINFIFITNIGFGLLTIFLILLILGLFLKSIGSYCYDLHTEIIRKENNKS